MQNYSVCVCFPVCGWVGVSLYMLHACTEITTTTKRLIKNTSDVALFCLETCLGELVVSMSLSVAN